MSCKVLMALLPVIALLAGCGGLGKLFPLGLREHESASKFVGEANPLTIDIPVEQPSADKPVTLGAAVDRTRAAAGESILLVVRCKTVAPWYIYAADGEEEIGVPTRLDLKLPTGVTQQSPWQLPQAKPKNTPLGQVGTYATDVRFLVPLLINPLAPAGKLEVQCDFHYQACSDSTCLSPATQKLVIPLTIEPK